MTDWDHTVMICNQWPEYIGRSKIALIPHLCPDLGFRDGQKRPVFIYRFLTAGAIDGMFTIQDAQRVQLTTRLCSEKIFQRQVTKLGLSNCR